ncbi:MAG: AbrB/MazE/SpoVT family DNA-binding domain-containing protein [Candidatus Daviesbacteria bacterium]|nr:AbrB/MazE/SpoVT family DNA-binding domain-containing protein [Candidatus Daviesbacteria bacterium]
MIRKIISLGKYSAVVSLPKELMRKLGWKRGQKVEVSSKRKKIEIKDF